MTTNTCNADGDRCADSFQRAHNADMANVVNRKSSEPKPFTLRRQIVGKRLVFAPNARIRKLRHWRAHPLGLSLAQRNLFLIMYTPLGPDECWVWRGRTDGKGYGLTQMGRGSVSVRAHRLAYRLARGQSRAAWSCSIPATTRPA